MTSTRRGFLRGLLGGLLGFVALSGLPAGLRAPGPLWGRARAAPRSGIPAAEPAGAHAWAFVVDSTRCIGCGLCVRACKEENWVPKEIESSRTWVERYVFTRDREVFVDSPDAGIEGFAFAPANAKYESLEIFKSYFVPKLCNQCDNPPCVQVCPVGATYKTEDGVILVDDKHCIGCKYCIQACPYGARYLNPYSRTVDKCTWCYHRIHRGLDPACVEICPVGARVFGDRNDPESRVSRMLQQETTSVLKPSLGTEPKVYYIGIGVEVR